MQALREACTHLRKINAKDEIALQKIFGGKIFGEEEGDKSLLTLCLQAEYYFIQQVLKYEVEKGGFK